jgi:hypothetical protein
MSLATNAGVLTSSNNSMSLRIHACDLLRSCLKRHFLCKGKMSLRQGMYYGEHDKDKTISIFPNSKDNFSIVLTI